MELHELCAALRASASDDMSEVKRAESNETVKGHASNLFRIVVEEGVEAQVRLSAAISFKRVVERGWDPDEEDGPKLSDEDKDQVRRHIVEAVVRCEGPIRLQLIEVMKAVVYSDFPEAWPDLSGAVVQSLHAQDVNQKIFDDLLMATVPKILDVLRTCALSQEPVQISAEILKAICKFFWSVTFTKLPDVLTEPDNVNALMETLLLLVKKELPWNLLPPSKEEQDKWIWWKTKKWVLHLTTRFFKYYGVVDKAKEKDRAFAEMFANSVSIPMLEAHMHLLATVTRLPNPNERIMAQLVNYMDHAVSINQTYKVIKDHLKPMLINIVFPLLCFNDADEELLRDDPEEYVRKSHDLLEDVFGLKATASNFAVNVCRLRGKLVLQDFLSHLLGIMGQYIEAKQENGEPVELARRMDGALTAFGALEHIVLKKKAYRANIEDLLIQFIVPCFQSRFGHLRSRACWVAGKYSSTKFKDGRGSGPTFQSLLHSVVMAMKDTEIENEDIVFTLETIVEKLGEEIAPFAEHLAWNLAAAFKKCLVHDQEDDMESLCAFGCLRAMNALIGSTTESPSLYVKLEDIFYPVIDSIFVTENQELFEDVIDMISYFVYYGSEISPRMWSMVPRLYQAYMTWAFDYLGYIADCLEHYIVKGRQVFLYCKEPDYMTLLNQMIEHAMTGDVQEVDYHPALKLVETAMQHLKGEIDNFIPSYLELILSKWPAVERSDTKVLCANVVANGLWYNAALTVMYLKQRGVLHDVFSKWFEMIFTLRENGKMKYFLKHSDKKICILGLSTLLTVSEEQYPSDIPATQVLAGVMKLLEGIRRQEEDVQPESEDEDYVDEDSEVELEEADEDEGECVSNASSAYNKLLEKETKRLLLGYQGSDSDDYCESDLSSDNEDAPIYYVDPYIAFSEMLEYLESVHGARLQSMLSEMDDARRNTLHEMMDYGRKKREERAKGVLQLNGSHD